MNEIVRPSAFKLQGDAPRASVEEERLHRKRLHAQAGVGRDGSPGRGRVVAPPLVAPARPRGERDRAG